jgi:hypothetical protein
VFIPSNGKPVSCRGLPLWMSCGMISRETNVPAAMDDGADFKGGFR